MTDHNPAEQRLPRCVVAAAIKLKDSRVLCGVRHFDELMRTWLPQSAEEAQPILAGHEQGFVDNTYQFLDRNQAWDVAEAAGQIIVSDSTIRGCLHSEDLW